MTGLLSAPLSSYLFGKPESQSVNMSRPRHDRDRTPVPPHLHLRDSARPLISGQTEDTASAITLRNHAQHSHSPLPRCMAVTVPSNTVGTATLRQLYG